MNRYYRYLTAALALLMLFTFASEVIAQEAETLICDECKYENELASKFCVDCGDPLSEEYSRWQVDKQSQDRYLKHFISDHIDPQVLFTVPVARVLGSMDVRVMGGGAVGVATDRSFLGNVSIGLGDIAEVEFSTVGMVTNIARGSTVFPTSAFKFMLIPENKWHIPTLAVALRNSANWQDVQSDERVLQADAYKVGFLDEGIYNIGYDTRFTTMFGVTTVRLWSLSVHAGVSLTDIRVRDLNVQSYLSGDYADTQEKQKNLVGGFFGFDIESNPQTKLLFEARTISSYQYNVETKEIDVSEAYLAIGGVRFFFNRWLSTDVGVWYQSTFRGIADVQIKLGLNLFIPGGSLGDRVRELAAKKKSPTN